MSLKNDNSFSNHLLTSIKQHMGSNKPRLDKLTVQRLHEKLSASSQASSRRQKKSNQDCQSVESYHVRSEGSQIGRGVTETQRHTQRHKFSSNRTLDQLDSPKSRISGGHQSQNRSDRVSANGSSSTQNRTSRMLRENFDLAGELEDAGPPGQTYQHPQQSQSNQSAFAANNLQQPAATQLKKNQISIRDLFEPDQEPVLEVSKHLSG